MVQVVAMDGSTSKRHERCCDTEKEDRISKLPDSILCHILSFLPTLSCVRTSCLSRRWKFLWTSVPSLHFDYCDFSIHSRTRYQAIDSQAFENFVNTVFILHLNPSIKKLCLHLPLLPHSTTSTSYVNSWILAACTHYVEELDINACFVGINIPPILFDSKKLVSFKLSSDIALKVPEFVSLPSLKVLHLQHRSCPAFTYINRIISGCPVLEDLAMDVLRDQNNIETLSIVSSSLKRFELRNKYNDFYTVNINAPRLKMFHLTDVYSLKPQIEINNVSSIKKAIFDFTYCGCEFSRKRFSNLFLTRAGTTYKAHFWENLTHLVLSYCVIYLDILPIILRLCPKLEDLELKYQYCDHTSACEELKKEKLVICLKNSLKILKLRSFEGKEEDMRMTEYFLNNAQVLKEIRIYTEKELEVEVFKKLLMFPRCSKTCQVTVFS